LFQNGLLLGIIAGVAHQQNSFREMGGDVKKMPYWQNSVTTFPGQPS